MKTKSMPWWGHTIVVTLIVGSTLTAMITGNLMYVIAIPFAWFIGTRLQRSVSREG